MRSQIEKNKKGEGEGVYELGGRCESKMKNRIEIGKGYREE